MSIPLLNTWMIFPTLNDRHKPSNAFSFPFSDLLSTFNSSLPAPCIRGNHFRAKAPLLFNQRKGQAITRVNPTIRSMTHEEASKLHLFNPGLMMELENLTLPLNAGTTDHIHTYKGYKQGTSCAIRCRHHLIVSRYIN